MFILLINYGMNYLDNYPEKKLEHGIYLDFKLLSLRKISTIDYAEYQKTGTGKLVQRIENGLSAGRNVVFRDLIPTIVFSVYFIWKIDKKVTYVLFAGYILIFIITNILLKFLYKIKEKILNSEELFNHYLVRGFMEMLVFRMSKQFPNEIKKTNRRFRHLAKLDRLRIDMTEHRSGLNKHLFGYIEYCGMTSLDFVRQYQ